MPDYIKSPMNYTGGKYKILEHIIPSFPESINNFVDLFAGGLNVGINVQADTIYANDRLHIWLSCISYFKIPPLTRYYLQLRNGLLISISRKQTQRDTTL